MLVVGLGRSGLAAAELCLREGAEVTANDSRPHEAFGDALTCLEDRAQLSLGAHPKDLFTSADLIVLSPGVPPLPALDAARRAGVLVIGEMELGSRFVRSPIVGITGTNGKSTTTKLVGEMLEAAKIPVFCGGNLGQPLCEAINAGHPAIEAGVVVLEISSFQLETVQTFHAHIAVLLNVSEDHLDRYPNYESYLKAKARLFERQTMDDFVVVNADPGQVRARELASRSGAPRLTFRSAPSRGSGAWTHGDQLCMRLPQQKEEYYPRSALRIPGSHNSQNALAALLIARLAGASSEACQRALETFEGLPHRMQLVGDHDDIRFYNDSKATNVGSVVGSLSGFDREVVLIAGGKDKGGDYGPLAAVLEQTCRHVVLIGSAAARIEEALKGAATFHRAQSMEEAVTMAADLAKPGDAVVLSPACSSYDMFKDYIARGQAFAAAVAGLSRG
ncbi:MAG: UDP-N-acetylmuramoyl-L-alanine--D-glutamate ligase [Deltaproteobacteria bacterium]|nr:UDP-N-acetylmuramoyl-L-alanine--D-glutamate ligase [Deltaproteobacteria bacterium]